MLITKYYLWGSLFFSCKEGSIKKQRIILKSSYLVLKQEQMIDEIELSINEGIVTYQCVQNDLDDFYNKTTV